MTASELRGELRGTERAVQFGAYRQELNCAARFGEKTAC